ncbi:uncharacterized protein LOC132305339 [Cornus florida]|uniref:uncharacterized protein LOC132305339 n=1 Tax=Cornus florida TaxID=4283 RepID=UPI00289CF0DE|nr:uncharacterized protein LOC132305339 [Cornus florida]
MVSNVEEAMKKRQQEQQQQQQHNHRQIQCNKGKASKFKRSTSNLEEDGASSAILLLAFDIDSWLDFAIEKRVKSLALEFIQRTGISRLKGEKYNFPNTNLLHSKFLGFTNCISLTKLVLSYVDVTGQVLEYLLINCPFSEQLFVEESESLVNLKVPDLAVKLKRLEINLCFNVKSTEIYATNLMSFKYFGDLINMPFKNDQELVDLFIGSEYCNHLICNFFEISSYLSRLESLTLKIVYFEKNKIQFAKFPVFNKLKQLELKLAVDNALLALCDSIPPPPCYSLIMPITNREENGKV